MGMDGVLFVPEADKKYFASNASAEREVSGLSTVTCTLYYLQL